MRNLRQYPITDEEVFKFLDELSEEYDYRKTGLIGDIRPAIINHLRDMTKMPRVINVFDRLAASENEKVSKS